MDDGSFAIIHIILLLMSLTFFAVINDESVDRMVQQMENRIAGEVTEILTK